MGAIYDWLEEGFELQLIGDDLLSKFIPSHVNIFYCFGGIVLTSFIVQSATGVALTLYYRSSVVQAFHSVEFILLAVHYGWFIHSIHRWSSSLLVLALLCMALRTTIGCSKYFFWSHGIFIALGSIGLLGF